MNLIDAEAKFFEIDIDTYSIWLKSEKLPKSKFYVDNSGTILKVYLLEKDEDHGFKVPTLILPQEIPKSVVSRFVNKLEQNTQKTLERKSTPIPIYKTITKTNTHDQSKSDFQKVWDVLDERKEHEISKKQDVEVKAKKSIEENQLRVKTPKAPTPKTPRSVRERVPTYELEFPLTPESFAFVKAKLVDGKLPSIEDMTQIYSKVEDLLRKESSMNRIAIPRDGEVVIIGDLHGQLFDLLTLIELNGLPSEHKLFLFNGDLVDRGHHSVEVLTLIFILKLVYPDYVYINKGNHENQEVNSKYGFKTEAIMKLGRRIYDAAQSAFDYLPYATLIDNKYLVVHGGLAQFDDVTLEEIENLPRPQGLITNERLSTIATHLLWSDPVDEDITFKKSIRGNGVFWGTKLTDSFLERNGLSMLVRSHQKKDEGFAYQHSHKVLTVFSASLYCGVAKNLGATVSFSNFEGSLKVRETTYIGSVTYDLDAKCKTETIKQLKNRIFQNRHALLTEFFRIDKDELGVITIPEWIDVMTRVLELSIPWETMQPYLCSKNKAGKIVYSQFHHRYSLHVEPKLMKKFKARVIETVCEKIYHSIDNLRKVFSQLDKNGDGFLSYKEFIDLLKSVEISGISEDQMMDFVSWCDPDRVGQISVANFEKAFQEEWGRTKAKRKHEKPINYIRTMIEKKYKDLSTAFKAWDKNHDARISYVEFMSSMHNLDDDDRLSDIMIRELFQLVDRTGDFKLVSKHDMENVFGSKGEPHYATDLLQNMLGVIHAHKTLLFDIFRSFDVDDVGKITMEEIDEGISALNIALGAPISNQLISDLHHMIKKDNSGQADYKEFLSKFKVVDGEEILE